MPPKFFITHSWKDIEFARKLTNDLRAHGLDGFFDAYSIKPGDKIANELQRGLEQCDIYIPILSEAALASPWCDEEINAALTLSNKPERNGRPRIIPVLIQNCQDKIPLFLRTRLYISFHERYDDALRELLSEGLHDTVLCSTGEGKPLRFRADAWYLPDDDWLGFVEIPEGSFWMGSNENETDGIYSRASPRHQVHVLLYYIGKYPVTVAQYRVFLEDTNQKVPFGQNHIDYENHPVVFISWYDALRYCNWLTARLLTWSGTPQSISNVLRTLSGGFNWLITLPSEAEWEKAAQGSGNASESRIYPWGNQSNPNLANFVESGFGTTTPVGSFAGGCSPYGIYDMSGNVCEWTRSNFGTNIARPMFIYPYKSSDGREDILASDSMYRVIRGGSFYSSAEDIRISCRRVTLPRAGYDHVGFRLVVTQMSKSEDQRY